MSLYSTPYLHTDHLTMQCGVYRHMWAHMHILCTHIWSSTCDKAHQNTSLQHLPSAHSCGYPILHSGTVPRWSLYQGSWHRPADGLIGATSSKVGIGKGNWGPREAQLTAYHLGILYSPEVITHGTLGNLHPPLQSSGASHQPDLHIDHWSGCVWKKKKSTGRSK